MRRRGGVLSLLITTLALLLSFAVRASESAWPTERAEPAMAAAPEADSESFRGTRERARLEASRRGLGTRRGGVRAPDLADVGEVEALQCGGQWIPGRKTVVLVVVSCAGCKY
jgi:hypothetical protein